MRYSNAIIRYNDIFIFCDQQSQRYSFKVIQKRLHLFSKEFFERTIIRIIMEEFKK